MSHTCALDIQVKTNLTMNKILITEILGLDYDQSHDLQPK